MSLSKVKRAKLFFLCSLIGTIGVAAVPTSINANKVLERKFKESLAQELGTKIKFQVDRFFVRDQVPADARVVNLLPHPAIGLVNIEYVWDESGTTHHATGSATVKAYAPVAVAKTAIRHQDVFSSDNVVMEERELTSIRVSGFYDGIGALSSLRANGFLSPGMVIDFRHTQAPNLVSSGEMIDLVRETESMRIVARVRALESGKRNQWIRVENPLSKKVIQARVVDNGTVHLN